MKLWIQVLENVRCASADPESAKELLKHNQLIRVATKYLILQKTISIIKRIRL